MTDDRDTRGKFLPGCKPGPGRRRRTPGEAVAGDAPSWRTSEAYLSALAARCDALLAELGAALAELRRSEQGRGGG